MFSEVGLDGRSLAAGELCLTFDDGPGAADDPLTGPRTLALAEYLAEQEVPAAFFVVGKHVEGRAHVVERLRRLGHLVGNHTHRHPNLVDLHAVGGDVAAEVALADAVIPSAPDRQTTFFRPPYGTWSAAVARTLNDHVGLAVRHVGPVMWDIDGRDWAAWRSGTAPDRCAAEYRRVIDAAGRGIVLMHDSTADSDIIRERNNTFDMVRTLVPELRASGYRFLPLDLVPGIAQTHPGTLVLTGSLTSGDEVRVPVCPGVGDRTGSAGAVAVHWGPGRRVSLGVTGGALVAEGGGGGRLFVSEVAGTLFEPVPLSTKRMAFRAPTGHFVNRCAATGVLGASGTGLGDQESFACDVVGPGPGDRRSPLAGCS